MKINADFSQRVVVHSTQTPWQASPMQGVHRRPLDRVGGEIARATSIVRYAPGSHFSPHVHSGGEEFLVLEGVFQDEHGDYPKGTYVRNPPCSQHKPGSEQGCVIFVKLWQFQPDDRNQFSVQTEVTDAIRHADQPGVSTVSLYDDNYESVHLVQLDADNAFSLSATGGAELLMLQGEFTEGKDRLAAFSWLRLPVGEKISGIAGPSGARFWLKTGHLTQVESEIQRVATAR